MRMASENPTRNPPFTGQSPAFAGNAGPARPEPAYRQSMDIAPATGDIGRPRGSQARTVFGLVLMLVGMLLLLDRLDWWGVPAECAALALGARRCSGLARLERPVS